MQEIVTTAVGAVVIGMIGFMWYQMRSHYSKVEETVKKRLYRGNGTTIFMPRDEFRQEQERCQARLHTEIAEVKGAVDALAKTQIESTKELAHFMGRIEQHIKNGS